MMNNDGTTGGNNVGLTQTDDQQMITLADRENYIARLTHHLGGNREMAKYFDDEAITKSGGKANSSNAISTTKPTNSTTTAAATTTINDDLTTTTT
ncbi:unnamed protein product, partial [Rotaria sp. Silwood2]